MKSAISNDADTVAYLLIADIRLGDENGIETAHFIQSFFKNLFIIFITGFPEEYYEEIFRNVKPYGFLGKPVKTELLIEYINEIELLIMGEKKKISIKCNGDIIDIEQKNIMYFESKKRRMIVYTVGKTFSTYCKLKDVENTLSEKFIRCHKSFIVNLDFIFSMNKCEFVICDGKTVPISRPYEKDARIKYFLAKGNLK